MAVDLTKVGRAMFNNKGLWVDITKEEKEEAFFIFNRYLSKKYPFLAEKLNTKSSDKEICMDIWFRFLYDKPFPQDFWSKVDGKKEKTFYTENDIHRLMKNNNLDKTDVYYLIEHNEELIKEELKYYKQIDKG